LLAVSIYPPKILCITGVQCGVKLVQQLCNGRLFSHVLLC